MFLKTGGSLVDCGTIIIEVYSAEDLEPLNLDIFDLTLSDQISSLEVLYTEDPSMTGEYDILYKLHYKNYPAVGDEQVKPFTVTIKDPCENPTSLVATDKLPEGLVKTYTISEPEVVFEFGEFIIEPPWCEVSYTYTINDSLG